MRRTLVALMFTVGLSACGGVEEAPETEQPMSVEQAVCSPKSPGPYCWNLNGTTCSRVGTTTCCTDGIWFDYSCKCGSNYRWDCDEVR
ncbi:hypothetical protein ACLESD_10015 [Pyxidicoccus sp. 3LFB2]